MNFPAFPLRELPRSLREVSAPRDASTERAIKKRGILLSTAGYLLVAALVFVLDFKGLYSIERQSWLLTLGLIAVVQSVLWLIPHLGWDRELSWDPHYLILPMLGAVLILSVYTYFMPGGRFLLLMGWFVALLFMAGLAGFTEVVLLSAAMAVGHLGALGLVEARSGGINLAEEFVTVGIFLSITLFAGIVFERLRRDRREMKALRNLFAERSVTDPLTGLPNRRYFKQVLETELQRLRRYDGSCSVAMLDVDSFKNYNDCLGHLAGDGVLRELATVFREHLRTSDIITRYGGEEFALVMVNTSPEDAFEVVERLRGLIQSHPFRDEHVQPRQELTISAGIANCPEHGITYEALIQEADRALYRAKEEGRNRVSVAAA